MKQYRLIAPVGGIGFRELFADCLGQIQEQIDGSFRVIRIVVFVDVTEDSLLAQYRQVAGMMLEDAFREACPAWSLLAQPPRSRHGLMCEVMGVADEAVGLLYQRFNLTPYVIVQTGHTRELWVSGLGGHASAMDIEASCVAAFDEMVSILSQCQMTLNNVVRQWNYVPHILVCEGDAVLCERQNYQVLNEVRRHYYGLYRTVGRFPAATGIGTSAGGVTMDVCAVESDEVRVVPVDNPVQLPPYRYSQQLLVGKPPRGASCKQAPQFERAVMVHDGRSGVVYVSGTASIVGEQTVGLGDVGAQTRQTLQNIRQLASVKNIGDQDLSLIGFHVCPYYLRGYVKNVSDFEEVMRLCCEAYPGVPVALVQADVCRDDLLVEIEGEFIVKNGVAADCQSVSMIRE